MNRYTRLSRNGIYRSRSGLILGVCKGLAEHFDFSVFWTRVIALILLFVAGFFPAIGLYLLAALLMKPEPVIPVGNPAEKEFYDSYTYSRQGAVQRLKRRYENLQKTASTKDSARTTKWVERLESWQAGKL
jgi:phage shock protein C